MADFSALKTAIQTYIKQNGNEEITGEILQEILLSVVTTLGDSAINDLVTALANEVAARQNADGTLQQNITNEATARGNADTALQGLINGVKNNVDNGYVYAGIATPSSTPTTGKVFYLALTAGTYTNFGSTVVSQGINILKYNGSAWSLDVFIGIDDTPTPNSPKLVKSGGAFESVMTNGSAFDISAHFASGGTLATYADLNAALTALNTLSASYKRGGMSIKFVQSSDNKYVQYRLTSDSFSITITDWQKIDRDDYAPKKYLDKYDGNNIVRRLYIDTANYTGSLNLENLYITSLQGGLPYGAGKYYWGFSLFAGVPGNGSYITETFSFITDSLTPPDEILSKTVQGIYVYAEFDWSKLVIGTAYGPYIIQPFARQKTQDPRGSIHQENLDATLIAKLEQIQTNKDDIDDLNDDVSEINGAIDYVSKNLFDPNNVVDGFIDDNGVFFNGAAWPGKWKASGHIPVKPNTIYYLQGRAEQSIMPVPSIACYDENGTPMRVLQPNGAPFSAGNYYYMYGSSSSVKNPNGGFMTPAGAKTLRFTLVWDFVPESIGDVMLEEVGTKWDLLYQPSPYEPYNLIPEIKTESLPESISILKGKKILYNGDSICEPRLLYSAAYNNGGAYQTLISEATGSINVNYAVSGANISNNGSSGIHKVVLDVVNMDDDADLVCFEGGINDWSTNVPLGTYTEGDYTSTFDNTTILGAMESIFQQSLAKWPGVPIVFVIVHKVHNSFVPHGPSGNQHTFAEVKDKMIEVCNKWGIPYYNAFDSAALNGGIASQVGQGKFLYDEWHPARKGYVHYYVPQLIKLFESLLQVNRDY